MRILGIDFETTGLLDNPDARIIEIGAVLWEVGRGPLEVYSQLVHPSDVDLEIPELITELTGINNEDMQEFGKYTQAGLSDLNDLMLKADFCMAHNASFDKSFYDKEIAIWGSDPVTKVWIDTMTDIQYPKHCQSKKLKYLAADHGVRLPESLLHRALYDVSMMLAIAENYDYPAMVKSAKSPTHKVRAVVTYQDRQLAKDSGFHWDGPEKSWYKDVKEYMLKDFTEECEKNGFNVADLGVK